LERYEIDIKRDEDDDDEAKEPRDEIDDNDVRRDAFGSILDQDDEGNKEKKREFGDNRDCLYEHLV